MLPDGRLPLCVNVNYVLNILEIQIEQVDSSGNTPDLHSGGARMEPRSSHRLPWLIFFVVFLSPSRKILILYLKLGHDHFHLLSPNNCYCGQNEAVTGDGKCFCSSGGGRHFLELQTIDSGSFVQLFKC
jgi:hypothetical protein